MADPVKRFAEPIYIITNSPLLFHCGCKCYQPHVGWIIEVDKSINECIEDVNCNLQLDINSHSFSENYYPIETISKLWIRSTHAGTCINADHQQFIWLSSIGYLSVNHEVVAFWIRVF